MLVKCTVSGTTYEVARRKMLRALVEFRIRGVKVSLTATPYPSYVDSLEPGVDQHPILIPPIDSRYLHWRQNLDDG